MNNTKIVDQFVTWAQCRNLNPNLRMHLDLNTVASGHFASPITRDLFDAFEAGAALNKE